MLLEIWISSVGSASINYVCSHRRTPTTIVVRESHVEKMGKIQDVVYEILNVLEFNRYEFPNFG